MSPSGKRSVRNNEPIKRPGIHWSFRLGCRGRFVVRARFWRNHVGRPASRYRRNGSYARKRARNAGVTGLERRRFLAIGPFPYRSDRLRIPGFLLDTIGLVTETAPYKFRNNSNRSGLHAQAKDSQGNKEAVSPFGDGKGDAPQIGHEPLGDRCLEETPSKSARNRRGRHVHGANDPTGLRKTQQLSLLTKRSSQCRPFGSAPFPQ